METVTETLHVNTLLDGNGDGMGTQYPYCRMWSYMHSSPWVASVYSLQVVAEQQEKTTLEETLTSEISNLQEQLGKRDTRRLVLHLNKP